MEKKIYTVDEVRHNLATNQVWVERAIVKLFEYQTAEEQQMQATIHHNKVGFNGFDGRSLSYLAKWLNSGKHLNGKYLVRAHKMVPKYAKQILNLINEKV